MSQTSKPTYIGSANNIQREVYNPVDKSLQTSGFLVGKVGHKITRSISTTTISNDTELFSYYDNATLLYTIKIIYVDGTREEMLSAERVA